MEKKKGRMEGMDKSQDNKSGAGHQIQDQKNDTNMGQRCSLFCQEWRTEVKAARDGPMDEEVVLERSVDEKPILAQDQKKVMLHMD